LLKKAEMVDGETKRLVEGETNETVGEFTENPASGEASALVPLTVSEVRLAKEQL
jgi:hypothetical protein